MKDFHVIIDQDDDKELVYNPTEHTDLLDMIAAMHPCPKWTFEREDYQVTVYPIALFRMPVGEEREEIEHRILKALNLIPPI